MGRPLKIAKLMTSVGVGKDIGYPNVGSLTSPVTPNGLDSTEFYGVVGGQIEADGGAAAGPGAGNPVVQVRVKIGSNSEANGFIVRQKGSRKYLVEDASGNTGVCTLVNLADSNLTADSMTITVFTSDSSAIRLKKLTDKYGTDWSDNVYFVNMFQGVEGETAVKSGGEAATFAGAWSPSNGGTIELARVETTFA